MKVRNGFLGISYTLQSENRVYSPVNINAEYIPGKNSGKKFRNLLFTILKVYFHHKIYRPDAHVSRDKSGKSRRNCHQGDAMRVTKTRQIWLPENPTFVCDLHP